jgi:hypothetical protein
VEDFISGKQDPSSAKQGNVKVTFAPKARNQQETAALASLQQTIGPYWIETGPIAHLDTVSLKTQ